MGDPDLGRRAGRVPGDVDQGLPDHAPARVPARAGSPGEARFGGGIPRTRAKVRNSSSTATSAVPGGGRRPRPQVRHRLARRRLDDGQRLSTAWPSDHRCCAASACRQTTVMAWATVSCSSRAMAWRCSATASRTSSAAGLHPCQQVGEPCRPVGVLGGQRPRRRTRAPARPGWAGGRLPCRSSAGGPAPPAGRRRGGGRAARPTPAGERRAHRRTGQREQDRHRPGQRREQQPSGPRGQENRAGEGCTRRHTSGTPSATPTTTSATPPPGRGGDALDGDRDAAAARPRRRNRGRARGAGRRGLRCGGRTGARNEPSTSRSSSSVSRPPASTRATRRGRGRTRLPGVRPRPAPPERSSAASSRG